MTARGGSLPSVYEPAAVESKWRAIWEQGDLFQARADSNKPAFSVVIPPPNVTGSLHMGHALNNTLQDVMVRWHRMRGFETLWLPGTDHAGIATQHVVEKMLRQEGLTRYDLGREKFIERVWEWKRQYGDTILNQLRRLGASCDWSRLRFTMDEGCSRAVREVFVTLYNKGLIFQDDYITNWCPVCGTALSDLEVEHEEAPGKLWYVHYDLDGEAGHITIATTRPETILGDTAIAVNPADERYAGLIGRWAIVPVIGRRIPIIADEYVDPEFGTGAVKITPAHDPNDFDIGKRHALPSVTVIGRDGKMTEEAGPYAGLDRYECRRRLVEALASQGRIDQIDDHAYALGHCYRCNTAVEPLVSRQWFVKTKELAGPAIEAVRRGDVKFVPERFAKTYLNWLENVHNWCISRQIWWGHRIPVWYCEDCHQQTVAVVDPTGCSHCGSDRLHQDEDVLDTWFSSALWPFSTMGWPDDTPELGKFFPTTLLVTAYDIIFFWVARMVFMSYEFMGQQPFSQVIIHGVVRDAEGRRMSKSKGTGIDPLEAIDKWGADALRLCLLTGASPGNDQRFRWERIDGSRNFCNKLWNAARFALMNLDDADVDRSGELDRSELQLADRWILSRLERTRERVGGLLEAREIGEAASVLYSFVWDELCDWYVELIKPRLYGRIVGDDGRVARCVLWTVLDRTMKMLHPFLPFITEEIWQALGGDRPSLAISDWPAPRPEWLDPEAERDMGMIMDLVRAIRNLRAEIKLPPSKTATVEVLAADDQLETIRAQAEYIESLSGAKPLLIRSLGKARPKRALAEVIEGAEAFLPLEGLVDLDKELARLNKDLAELERDLASVRRRLSDERFLAKAPAEVVAARRERLEATEDKIARLKKRISELS